jgi:hypothetical protein
MNVYPILIGLALVTLLGALAGIWLAETPKLSQSVLPFSGGLLVGIALFWQPISATARCDFSGLGVDWRGGSGGAQAGDRRLGRDGWAALVPIGAFLKCSANRKQHVLGKR